jgi:hypothetical protein
MTEKRYVFPWQIYFGIVLILTGGLFLADLFLPEPILRLYWPLLVVLFGLTFIVGMLSAKRRGAGLAIPGTIIITIGLLLFVQNMFNLWITWTYAWALLIVAIGLGLAIMNAYLKRDGIRRAAGLLIGIGLVLFVTFGVFFELILQVRGADLYSGIFLGGGLVLLGLFVVFSRALFGQRKLKPEKGKDKGAKAEPVDASFSESAPIPDPNGQVTEFVPEGATFSGLSFRSVGEVFVLQGEPCGLKIEGSDDLVDNIRVSVNDDILEVDYQTDVEDWTNFRWADGDRHLRYYVTMPTIQKINMEGAGILMGDSLQGDALELVQGGAGKIELHELNYKSLSADLGGLGEILLTGQVDSQNVDLSGAGGYEAVELQSQDAEVMVSGAGSAKVWAEKTLKATVTGIGSIKYKGDPAIEQENSGIGDIKPL